MTFYTTSAAGAATATFMENATFSFVHDNNAPSKLMGQQPNAISGLLPATHSYPPLLQPQQPYSSGVKQDHDMELQPPPLPPPPPPQQPPSSMNTTTNTTNTTTTTTTQKKKPLSKQPQDKDIPIKPTWKPVKLDEKPPFSYATIIAHAILSSEKRKLTLSEIYQWISEQYPCYSMKDHRWQNSIRHNLSLQKAFVKLERDASTPSGKGCFWTILPGYEQQFIDNLMKRGLNASTRGSSSSRSDASFSSSSGAGGEGHGKNGGKTIGAATHKQIKKFMDATKLNQANSPLFTIFRMNPTTTTTTTTTTTATATATASTTKSNAKAATPKPIASAATTTTTGSIKRKKCSSHKRQSLVVEKRRSAHATMMDAEDEADDDEDDEDDEEEDISSCCSSSQSDDSDCDSGVDFDCEVFPQNKTKTKNKSNNNHRRHRHRHHRHHHCRRHTHRRSQLQRRPIPVLYGGEQQPSAYLLQHQLPYPPPPPPPPSLQPPMYLSSQQQQQQQLDQFLFNDNAFFFPSTTPTPTPAPAHAPGNASHPQDFLFMDQPLIASNHTTVPAPTSSCPQDYLTSLLDFQAPQAQPNHNNTHIPTSTPSPMMITHPFPHSAPPTASTSQETSSFIPTPTSVQDFLYTPYYMQTCPSNASSNSTTSTRTTHNPLQPSPLQLPLADYSQPIYNPTTPQPTHQGGAGFCL